MQRNPVVLSLKALVLTCLSTQLPGCTSDEKRAQEFLAERGISLPTSTTDVHFTQKDDLRSLGYYIRFDVSTGDAATVAKALPCTAEKGLGWRAMPKGPASWFSAAEMTDISRCDTNGPYDGRFHFDVTTGRVEGRHRFLFSFSD